MESTELMRIPEPFFVIVNVIVRLLLRSPLHFLMSNSVLLINYVGRKSGVQYSTPVRYMASGSTIRCFTSTEVQWWRNLQVNSEVSLVVAGTERSYTAKVLTPDPPRIQALLAEFLAVYPQDAVYQEIRINSDGSLNREDLTKALHRAVVVEFEKG
jgi:deazaflavin-dependent oxidoreductase (nitroreductase family)